MTAERPERGRLAVLEGGDGSGKTEQSARLVESLRARGRDVKAFAFPVRTTTVGQLIDSHLRGERKFLPRVLHLLFAANRWEMAERIERALAKGCDVVLDRYHYSGAAYTLALDCGADMDWITAADADLPQADAVFFLRCPPEQALKRTAARRGAAEIYDRIEMQGKVAENFCTLLARTSAPVHNIDAMQSAEAVHRAILSAWDS